MHQLRPFFDDFRQPEIDKEIWFPVHLPHWSNREQAKASFELTSDGLRLHIAEGQKPWCSEFDGSTRVSNLQTAITAAALGATDGQHRFKPGLVVAESQEQNINVLMQHGIIEVRVKLNLLENNTGALWLVGLEGVPEDSGELCIFEVKHGADLVDEIEVGLGSKNHFDPRFSGEFETFIVSGASDWHTYKMAWQPELAEFFIDSKKVFETKAIPTYPLQLMLGVYDSSESTAKSGEMLVDYIRVTS